MIGCYVIVLIVKIVVDYFGGGVGWFVGWNFDIGVWCIVDFVC